MSPASTAPRTTSVPRDEWETPPHIRAQVQAAYDITLDVAASAENALTPRFYTEADNGLEQSWATGPEQWAWCNPPYSKKVEWLKKAVAEAALGNGSLLLLPVDTSTEWFHTYIWDTVTQKARTGVEVNFYLGRVNFHYQGKVPEGGSGNNAGSMLVVFHGAQVPVERKRRRRQQ